MKMQMRKTDTKLQLKIDRKIHWKRMNLHQITNQKKKNVSNNILINILMHTLACCSSGDRDFSAPNPRDFLDIVSDYTKSF